MTNAEAKIEPSAAPATLRLTRRFAAPREAVFRAWTDPEELAKWFGPEGVGARNVEIDLRPGGRYSLEMFETNDKVYPLSGVYRDVQPPERLVFTWIWGSGDFAGVETLVTIELKDANGGTELTLVHERLPGERAREMHTQGWTGSLGCLERLLPA